MFDKQLKMEGNPDLRGLRVAILTADPSGEAKGGAERFYTGLSEGFIALGCEADLVAVEANEPDFDTIVSNYQKCRNLDLSPYDIVVSTKVPTYAVEHPNHVLYLIHTVRVFDDMFDEAFNPLLDEHYAQRAHLHRIDFEFLSKIKSRFAIGHEVARRLYRWRGLDCNVLHPPLGCDNFISGKTGNYFFLPGRLHPWKRVDLIIEAIKRSNLPMKLLLAGEGENATYLTKLAGSDDRIEFLGKVDDERLVELYANCLAVPFVPLREDYGYVTLEAFSSSKPVLTCHDSGEPGRFVRPFETGLVVEPTAGSIQKGLEWFWENREQATCMGINAKQRIEGMSWSQTAYTLALSALRPVETHADEPTRRVAVLDMQPIDPPVGGGRQRLLGLYHNLGEATHCTYLGTYDWPGEPYRSHLLSNTLREIDVPLSDDHHVAAADLSHQAGGKTVIDLSFSQQAHLSPEFIEAARQQVAESEVVIFSHPWVYPLVKNNLCPDQVVIYDSHNVEGFLRAQLLDENSPIEANLLRHVVQEESDVGRAADWILACSREDLQRFNRVYGFPMDKMRVVPNGVMAFRDPLPTPEQKVLARQELEVEATAFMAIFIGSPYGPNVQAAEFIITQLAPLMPHVTFVIAGGVGEAIKTNLDNILITNHLNESDKSRWFYASDIAVNPMLSGSGTNIKMFDFMEKGLPVVTTRIGARGIETGRRRCMLLVSPMAQSFAEAIEELQDADLRALMGQDARLCVENGYAWERISEQLGHFVEARRRIVGQPKPFFSVVVPTYERHDQLQNLIECLQNQVERDFEVVIVDQSEERWTEADCNYNFPFTYTYSPVKGAVRARNLGAMLAQGSIIAFVDDDCQPTASWLLNARHYFADPEIVGIEGFIESEYLEDPNWRPVTNVGFEAMGFMTANLFVRSSAFQYLGGFDTQFDRPHFREDTDFGWRLQDIGEVPYAKDTRVFHPAQPRSNERESDLERAIFFQNDALLYRKHPDKYYHLFMAERHFEQTLGFSENLLLGFEACGFEPPNYISSCLNRNNDETQQANCMTSVSERTKAYALKEHASVEGWLGTGAITVTLMLDELQREAGATGGICEIGVHHGRLFILLALLRQQGELALAIDVFEDQELNVDYSGSGNRDIFWNNIDRHVGTRKNISTLAADSLTLSNRKILDATHNQRIRLFSVDGGHTARHLLNDVKLASQVLSDDGVVIVDDFYNAAWPGVNEGVIRYLMDAPTLLPFCYGDNKLYMCRRDKHNIMVDWVRSVLVPKSRHAKEVDLCGTQAIHCHPPSIEESLI